VKLDLDDIEVVLSGMLVFRLLEGRLLVLRLLEGRRTVEIFGLSTDRVGVVRRGGFGGVTNLDVPMWGRLALASALNRERLGRE